MKLKCINTEGAYPGTIEIGQTYELDERWPGHYMVNDRSVSLSNFETPIDILERFIKEGHKVLLSRPGKGYTVDVLLTDSYIVVYSHSRGNHWNISGNHFKYFHDLKTGEYVSDNVPNEKTRIKQRLLMADYNRLSKLII